MKATHHNFSPVLSHVTDIVSHARLILHYYLPRPENPERVTRGPLKSTDSSFIYFLPKLYISSFEILAELLMRKLMRNGDQRSARENI